MLEVSPSNGYDETPGEPKISLADFMGELSGLGNDLAAGREYEEYSALLRRLAVDDPELAKLLVLTNEGSFTKIPVAKEGGVYELNLIGLRPDQYTPAHHHNDMRFRYEMGINNHGLSFLYQEAGDAVELIYTGDVSPGKLMALPGRTIHQIAHARLNNEPFWLATLYIPSDVRSTYYAFGDPRSLRAGEIVVAQQRDRGT